MDAAERRRIQNREAQRRFRSKPVAAPSSVPFPTLKSDLNVGGHDLRPSTSHVDCATQWLNAFPLEKDATTGDLRWHQQPPSFQPAYGTPPETPKRSNPSHKTTNGGQVQESSDYNANYDDPDAFQTALHIAAIAGHDAMIDMLLANGRLAVDVRDSEGNTALHAAVASRKLVVVLRLLSHGADPNAENAAGWTPLHTAVQMGSVDVVGALVAHGGDVRKKAPMRNVDLME
ncbi:hypothetical protein CSUB01_09469 [Colletotrichum sublineola]|uniref:Uncharacterized protein n=1 Tax=Colletotrichum sublineola TaxID=1173701 RepID=A0A066XHF0_COLSU|nr:hypothetical protein CSUB01_09469 [Colletotrichum sublineola]